MFEENLTGWRKYLLKSYQPISSVNITIFIFIIFGKFYFIFLPK